MICVAANCAGVRNIANVTCCTVSCSVGQGLYQALLRVSGITGGADFHVQILSNGIPIIKEGVAISQNGWYEEFCGSLSGAFQWVSEPFIAPCTSTPILVNVCSVDGSDTTACIRAMLMELPVGEVWEACGLPVNSFCCGGKNYLGVNLNLICGTNLPLVTPGYLLTCARCGANPVRVDMCEALGTAITAAGGRMEVNTSHVGGSAVQQAAGYLFADLRRVGGVAVTAAAGRQEVNASHVGGSAIQQAGGYLRARDAADAALSTAAALVAVQAHGDDNWATTLIGEGSEIVDHDYGGTDALAYIVTGNQRVDEAVIHAFTKADYDANNRTSQFVVGATSTDVNGRWVEPMRLDPEVYTLVFWKQGEFGPDTTEITVVASC